MQRVNAALRKKGRPRRASESAAPLGNSVTTSAGPVRFTKVANGTVRKRTTALGSKITFADASLLFTVDSGGCVTMQTPAYRFAEFQTRAVRQKKVSF